jgi:multiple sugar transport system ATP-binding protein
MADRIGVLNEGRLVQIGTPDDIYDRPASMFVAHLIGTPGINLLNTNRENGLLHIDDSPIKLSLEWTSDKLPTDFVLGVRPEDVHPRADGDFPGEVTLIEPLGVETILHIKSGGQVLLSTVSGMPHWKIGEQIRFNIVREHLHFFDRSNQSRIAL